ncbi:MAG: efflux RND transporter periplasmic adaptor subunit [Ramlibacter sp.]
MPRLRLLVIVALLATLVALYAWLNRHRPAEAAAEAAAPAAAAAIPVVLGTATQAQDDADLDVLGSAIALRSVTLYPAVPGEIAELNFRAGQRVRADQPLMRLVDRSQRLAVDLAAARLDAAQRLLARYESTRGTGAVPGSVIDEARSGVALAAIELRQAREALADRVLRAPFAGVVGLSEVEAGDRVAIDTPITTLDDRRTVLVNFEVPEAHAARVAVGQALTVGNPAFGGRRFPGTIALVDSRVDAVSRNLRLRAAVPNPDDVLRPGMSFQVRLSLPGATHVAVPPLALQWDREGAYVWAVRGGAAARVPVRPVRRGQTQVLVDGALQVGERVVVEGVQRLRPGRAVRAVQPAAARPAASSPAVAASGAPR